MCYQTHKIWLIASPPPREAAKINVWCLIAKIQALWNRKKNCGNLFKIGKIFFEGKGERCRCGGRENNRQGGQKGNKDVISVLICYRPAVD